VLGAAAVAAVNAHYWMIKRQRLNCHAYGLEAASYRYAVVVRRIKSKDSQDRRRERAFQNWMDSKSRPVEWLC